MSIEVTGTYLFNIVDHGIAETSTGLPQWVAALQTAHYYDGDSGEWVEVDTADITAYLVLIGKKGQPLPSAKQLVKAVGWDGTSFESLHNMDLSTTQIQGRVEENEYEGNVSMRVVWVDAADAEPGQMLRKLDISEVKSLNAKFANGLRKLVGAPKPKSVPAKPKIPDEPKTSSEGVKAAMKAKDAEKAARGEKAEAKALKSLKAPMPKINKVTMEAAWEACCEGRPENVTDEILTAYWQDVIEEIGGEDEIEKKGLWGEVKEAVITKYDIPF